MIATLIIWCFISFAALCINSILMWRILRLHFVQSSAMRRLFVQKFGHAMFNAIVVIVAMRAANNAVIDAPPSLNVVLLTIGYTVQVITSVYFGLYALGMTNGGQPKIKDVDHDVV